MTKNYPFHDTNPTSATQTEIDAFNDARFRFSESGFILNPQDQQQRDATREAAMQLLELALRVRELPPVAGHGKAEATKKEGYRTTIW